uniref:Con-ikot-ikot 3 n=1 Tax=Conus geographus TaxID=6491 RepID=W4VSJ1_CONGE
MAMSMSMTLSVFVMVVMAATVTQLKKPDLSRMKRYNRWCCINKTYECLKNYRNRENKFASFCQQEAAVYCGTFESGTGCCYGYMNCMMLNAERDGQGKAHGYCQHRTC